MNCAAMGVRWGEEELVFWPFDATRTLRNLRRHGEAVVHLTDDVLLFVEAALGDPHPALRPAGAIDGSVIEEVNEWREVVVTEIAPLEGEVPRSRVRARVVARGTGARAAAGPVPRPARGRRGLDPRVAAEVAGRRPRAGRARPPSGARRQDRAAPRACGDGLRATLRERANVTEIVVTAPARLHFGMLDPAGLGARRFGGCGVGIESPRVVVGVRPRSGDEVMVQGRQAERAAAFARRARDAFGHRGGLEVEVREAIPPTPGSGRARSWAWRSPAAWPSWRASPPGPRSWRRPVAERRVPASASWTFAAPGLVVEAGVPDDGSISPLVARHPMPEAGGACWRCPTVERGSPATRRSASSASCTNGQPASRACRGCC